MSEQQLVYLYAFVPTEEYENSSPAQLEGIEAGSYVEYIPFGEVTAVTCSVGPEDFSEENLAKNTEDMTWLQEKAFHHHNMMNELHKAFTVLPLKFGTIYEQTANLESIVEDCRDNIVNLLAKLEGHEEWNVKIYGKDDKFRETAMADNREIEKKKQEIEQMPKGRQFFEKKKLGQFMENLVEKEIEKSCREVHDKLTEFSQADEIKKNWAKKVTGKTDEMFWNSAYLVPEQDVKAFLETIKREQEQAVTQGTGFTFEVTGPWPAYHFSNFTDRGVKSGT
ncbi:GvpL/GvpF family gas vesicle protein [Sediminibacillus massiliensis]|uniref:GvpL/GvpF family gas vesicle protein n=1 Tax=Sediminibacillus massiliensis TaxID=1926277 RepID=UPI00098840F4|nr:GvpL/GvpF family gas vesicle protein [Sediminibacillus massiliensis]